MSFGALVTMDTHVGSRARSDTQNPLFGLACPHFCCFFPTTLLAFIYFLGQSTLHQFHHYSNIHMVRDFFRAQAANMSTSRYMEEGTAEITQALNAFSPAGLPSIRQLHVCTSPGICLRCPAVPSQQDAHGMVKLSLTGHTPKPNLAIETQS